MAATTSHTRTDKQNQARRRWMGLLARADAELLARRAGPIIADVSYSLLRAPEQGLVMVQGRAGGAGRAFNFGEMSVTRCTVRLESGIEGHAYVAGRARDKAMQAAVIDALMQDEAQALRVEAAVIAPLERAEAEAREVKARKAAATRVDFFTMVRSEA